MTENKESQESLKEEQEEAVSQEVKEEQEQIDWKDKYIRLLAENENIKKRAEKDKQDAFLYSITKFAKEMVAIQDVFNKALKCIEDKELDDEIKPFVDGIQLTKQQLESIFEKFEIKEINPLNEIFDANFHEILYQAEDESKEDMTITEVFETGYVIKDRLIRAAKVVVSRKK